MSIKSTVAYPPLTLHRCLAMLFAVASDGQTVTLRSFKQRHEIEASLNEAVDSSFLAISSGTSKAQFVGKIEGHKFSIFCSFPGRNSWRPVLNGSIEQTAEGSLITAHFDFHPLAKIAAIGWLLGVGYAGVGMMSIDKHVGFQLLYMAGMIGPIALLVSLLVRGERKRLIALIESVS